MNISEIEVPFSSVFLAKRNSGKSLLGEYIMNKLLELKKIDVVYIFSKTCAINDNWMSIPQKYKHETMNYKKIDQIIKKQAKLCKSKSKYWRVCVLSCYAFRKAFQIN